MNSLRQQIDQAITDSLQQAVAEGAHRSYLGRYSEQLIAWLESRFQSHALLANSGTSALELSLRAAGVQPGDEVILSGYDYPGNFWVIEQLGCVPVLIDVLPNSTCIDMDQLRQAHGSRTRACVVSHLHGQFQPIVQLRAWADQNQIVLIEDACQSIGANLAGYAIGSIGHFGILSFSGSKVVSTGRGGALLTKDDRLFQKAKIASGAGSGAYSLSEVSSAIVMAQLPMLDTINEMSSTYFANLQQSIEQRSTSAGDRPGDSLKLSPLFGNTATSSENHALYQAGWICETGQQATAIADRLKSLGIVSGAGFPGFHRRSQRRCRSVSQLIHTASIVDRLLVIHHSIAIDERFSSQQLASEITGVLSELQQADE